MQEAFPSLQTKNRFTFCRFQSGLVYDPDVGHIKPKCSVQAIYSKHPLSKFSLEVGGQSWVAGRAVFDDKYQLYRLVFFKNEPVLHFGLLSYHEVAVTKEDSQPWPDLFWLPSDESIENSEHSTLVQNLDDKWNYIYISAGMGDLFRNGWVDERLTDPKDHLENIQKGVIYPTA